MTKLKKESILKYYFASAKDTLSEWENTIAKAEGQLALLSAGDKHETVYQAFREITFFACASMDDTKAPAKTR